MKLTDEKKLVFLTKNLKVTHYMYSHASSDKLIYLK
jgi:hypothetical protein